jgi:hypothetical protein
MTEYLVIIIFILWYTFSLVVSENTGKKSKLGVQWSFLISMIFSPIVGYIASKATKN